MIRKTKAGWALLIIWLACPSNAGAAPPNLVFQMSQECLSRLVDRDVNEQLDVEDLIQGSSVTGSAHTQGKLEAHFVPCQDHARIEWQFRGIIDSNTTSRKRGVIVSSIGKTAAGAVKRVDVWNAERIHVFPAKARCKTNLAIQNISTQYVSRTFKQKAHDAVYDHLDEMATASAKRAEDRVRNLMDQRFEQEMSQHAMLNPIDFMRSELAQSLPRAEGSMQTSREQLCYSERRLAEPSPKTWSTAPNNLHTCDLGIHIHETWFNSLQRALLADRWVTDEQIADGLKNLFGEVPREYRLGRHMARWSIHLHRDMPLVLKFTDGKISLMLNVAQTKIAGTLIDLSYQILVTYAIIPTVYGPELNRIGVSAITPTDGASEFEANADFRKFLESKCAGVFRQVLYFDGMVLPSGGHFEPLKSLSQAVATTRDGWLCLGWTFDRTPMEHVAMGSH